MKHTPLPELTYLHECFQIDADGNLIWKRRPPSHFKSAVLQRRWNGRYAGKIAGCAGHRGYRTVCISGVQFRASRVVFMLAHGRDPGDSLVDHHDMDTRNNAPGNLRLTDKSGNSQNTGLRSNNSSGVKGVLWRKERNRWRARVIKQGRRVERQFDDLEEAAAWIVGVREMLHGEFARQS